MKPVQPLPQEARYAQYLVYALALFILIDPITYMFGHSLQQNLVRGGMDLSICLMWLFFAWQFGRLRSWVRVVLMIFAILGVVGTVSHIVLVIIHRGNGSAYDIWIYYMPVAIEGLLLYLLTRPVVRDVFRAQRQSANTIGSG